MSVKIDVERLKTDRKYWDSVAPEWAEMAIAFREMFGEEVIVQFLDSQHADGRIDIATMERIYPPEPAPAEKKAIKLVYVAGPYRAATREAVAQNIAAARHVGRIVMQLGMMPVMPTVNTAMMDFDFPGDTDDAFWIDGTMELMRRCDAVVMVDGWQFSQGATGELEEARRLGIPVYTTTIQMAKDMGIDLMAEAA